VAERRKLSQGAAIGKTVAWTHSVTEQEANVGLSAYSVNLRRYIGFTLNLYCTVEVLNVLFERVAKE
jgi:hypothetical protein